MTVRDYEKRALQEHAELQDLLRKLRPREFDRLALHMPTWEWRQVLERIKECPEPEEE